MNDPVVFCSVGNALASHVVQLLDDAGVGAHVVPLQDTTATGEPARADQSLILIDPDDREHATAVISLVLPQLLDNNPGGGQLSDRLVRSDQPNDYPLPVWRGPASSMLDEAPADEDDDSFQRPEPPPIEHPRDLPALFGWAAVIIGPILLLLSIVFGLDGFWSALGLLAFVAGFATLIWRSGDDRDDRDNGAVV